MPRLVGDGSDAVGLVLSLRLSAARRGGATILGELRFDVAPGETIALAGSSGVGKTTLLRIMAGLDTDYDGEVTGPERVGMVFQEPVLLPWRSAAQNLQIACGLTRAGAGAALAEVGLGGMDDLYPGQLSLGQQRRLALARAFASRAPLLLMDEPFVSLDAETAGEVMAVFERLRARYGVSTVLVTHAEAEMQRLADRVLRLEGRPAQIASP